jgi:transcriptional regulator with PAS, ATPase and Fis domain
MSALEWPFLAAIGAGIPLLTDAFGHCARGHCPSETLATTVYKAFPGLRRGAGGRRHPVAYRNLMKAGDTTQSVVRRGPPAPEETLCLVWVYPQMALTPLSASPVSLGRSAESTVQLAGSQASRQHAEIVRRGKRWILVDLKSKNGSFVNGVEVTEAPLAEQDVVRLGEWLAVITFVRNTELDSARIVREIEPGLIGGPALRAAFERLSAVAKSDLNVMLVGETGTGKEFFARALNLLSGRNPFVPINCASIPEPLADAHLFGYKKGSFTGAVQDHAGFFQNAAGGTLFLDELEALPASVQAKLLRVLQEGRLAPLGHVESDVVDARVVCALQRPPQRAVEAGTLRADLFARLNGAQIHLPPLRTRREEVIAIFEHAIEESWKGALPSLDPDLAEWLLLYDWPLNAREVVQFARRISVEHSGERVLHTGLLAASFSENRTPRASVSDGEPQSTVPRAGAPSDERLLGMLLEALRETSGNVSLAAKKLHISRQRAYRLMAGRFDAWAARGNG